MGRPSNHEERRQQITQALRKVMARKGYESASIGDIAAAARLTPGLVHYHFKNKQEILLSVLGQLIGDHEVRIERALRAAHGQPLHEAVTFIDVHLSLEIADPEGLACWLMLIAEGLRQTRVKERVEAALSAWVDRLSGIIRRGVAAGLFHCASPAGAASALVAVIQGYMVLVATARGTIPRASAAARVREMANGLLQPSQPFPARQRP